MGRALGPRSIEAPLGTPVEDGLWALNGLSWLLLLAVLLLVVVGMGSPSKPCGTHPSGPSSSLQPYHSSLFQVHSTNGCLSSILVGSCVIMSCEYWLLREWVCHLCLSKSSILLEDSQAAVGHCFCWTTMRSHCIKFRCQWIVAHLILVLWRFSSVVFHMHRVSCTAPYHYKRDRGELLLMYISDKQIFTGMYGNCFDRDGYCACVGS